jgi:hypothetical protein
MPMYLVSGSRRLYIVKATWPSPHTCLVYLGCRDATIWMIEFADDMLKGNSSIGVERIEVERGKALSQTW